MLDYREDGKAGVVEIAVEGRISREEFDDVAAKLEAFIAIHGKVRLLEVIHDFEGIDASAFWDDLKFSLRHLNDFSRCAIVTRAKWVRPWSKLVGSIFHCELAHFEQDKIEEARAWLVRPQERGAA